ncbi:MAG: ParB N-terminal domain-containing protein [Thermodesulfobacteriota bacterium]
MKKLHVDKNFTPFPVHDDDELFPNGIFEFNITKLLEDIQNNPGSYILEEVAVSAFHNQFSSINENHLASVDISIPVIFAEIAPGRFNLIDGHHRLEKACRKGLTSLPAYRLNVEQHIKFLTSKKDYVTYIEYWNSKIGKGK